MAPQAGTISMAPLMEEGEKAVEQKALSPYASQSYMVKHSLATVPLILFTTISVLWFLESLDIASNSAFVCDANGEIQEAGGAGGSPSV
jgi:hypothetical protein